MAITYQGQTFSGFQEYVERNTRQRPSEADSTPRYAHPIDGWILQTLNSTPVKAVMSRAIDVLISAQFGHSLASSLPIDQKSFPDLYDVLMHCATTLDIPIPHAVTRHSSDLFNAGTAGTDEYHFITISSTLCEYYTRDEACFVIGHECGHIAASHMVYHTLVRVLTQTIAVRLPFPIGEILRVTAGVPLMAWSRRSEVTADRAGLLCCGDIAVAERALLRLITGLADVDRVDLEDYLRRSRSAEEFHSIGMVNELLASHPMIARRIEALRLFANSTLYYELSGKQPPPGRVLISQEELNQRVNEIVKP